MGRQYILLILLGTALIISGCAPVSKTEVSQPVVENTVVETDTVIAPHGTEPPSLTETATVPLPLVLPTSRGDQLVATDPASVNLTAGTPTLVEFFRFN